MVEKKSARNDFVSPFVDRKKNYAGLLFSVAKDVIYKSSHHAVLSLFTAKLFQFRNVFPFDVLHFLHGYRRVFLFLFQV